MCSSNSAHGTDEVDDLVPTTSSTAVPATATAVPPPSISMPEVTPADHRAGADPSSRHDGNATPVLKATRPSSPRT
jgi:hypothetical protein